MGRLPSSRKQTSAILPRMMTLLEAFRETEKPVMPMLRPKLKGKLEGSWACSAGYDLRTVFEFVKYESSGILSLLTNADVKAYFKEKAFAGAMKAT